MHRASSDEEDQDAYAVKAFVGQETLGDMIILENAQLPAHQQLRTHRIYRRMRIGRQSSDRLFEDCRPDKVRERPGEQEELLHNTLSTFRQW